jgi:methanogenic corrinoid protein MtbC1
MTDPPTAEPWDDPGLTRSIEGEIIPRLMMLFDHQLSSAAPVVQPASAHALSLELDAFVALVLENDADVVCEYIEQLREGGDSLPAVYLKLLAPAARRLGELWESDECSFATVTLGISRMHQVLLRFSPFFCANCTESPEDANSVLVIPVPGEQHTFGLMMLVEFFRREGWRVWSGSPRSDEELIGLLESDRFDVVGLSMATDRHLDSVPELLRAVRERSKNKNIRIIVGGRLFSEQPELAKKVGADATATDGVDAVRLAEQLVERDQ